MPDPATYRPAPGSIPEAPGVYRFSDAHGRVIYVGKAKSLRQRLNSYFADLAGLHPRTRQMVTTAAHVQWTVVTTEVEALQLEYNWIKEFDPRFNVRYRDDKTYPVLAVTMNEEFPRLHVYRGPRRKGVRYFGPFAHAWAIRETLDLLLRVFPARTCSAGVFKRHGQIGRPCLLGYIDKCSAPCVGRVDADEHRRIVEDFCDFLAGRTDHLIRQLERRMARASEELEFEKAARLRDDVGALRRAMERQAVVLGGGTDADVVAFADDELEAAVQVFHVRGGRVRGQRGWVIDKVEPTDTAQLVERFLTQFYGEQAALAEASDDAHQPVPKEIIVPELPAEVASLTEWLSGLRGSRVSVRVRAARRQAGARRDRRPQRRRGPHPAQAAPRGRPHRAFRGAGGDPGRARAGFRAAAHRVHRRRRTCRAPTWSPRWSCSRTGWRASRSTADSRSATVRRAATSPRSPRSCGGVSAATSRRRPVVRQRAVHARSPIAISMGVTSDPPRSRDPVTLPTWTHTTTVPESTPRPGGPASSRTRRTCWSSTVGKPRSRRRRTCWPSSASPTSPCAASPSALRRSGCPPSPTR